MKVKKVKHFTFNTCEICSKKFENKRCLKRHMLVHSDAYAYACSLCPYMGKRKSYLTKHMKVSHGAEGSHKCDVCDKAFHFKSKLADHMRTHTGDKPYECKVCKKSFSALYSLSSHNLIHTGEKPFQCSFCDYACRDSSTLRKHEHRHMGIGRLYQCKICSKTYKSKRQLKMHVAEKHLSVDIKKFKCHLCERRYKEKAHLTKHIECIHEKSTSCECSVCGKEISHRSNLTAHMRTHVDAKPFVCTYRGCTKRYKDRKSLMTHTLIHYPDKQYRCEVCERRFTRKTRYTKHMRRHFLGAVKKVECDYCGLTVLNKKHLVTHIHKLHYNEHQYECDACGFVTHDKGAMVAHVKGGHVPEGKQTCAICNKKYETSVRLKSHYRKKHGIEHDIKTDHLDVVIKDEPQDNEETVSTEATESAEQLEDSNTGPRDSTLKLHSDGATLEDMAKDIIQKNGKHLRKVPEVVFDDFFIEHVQEKPGDERSKQKDDVDRKSEAYVKKCVKRLLGEARRKTAAAALERVRRQYNMRIKEFAGNQARKGAEQIKFYKSMGGDVEKQMDCEGRSGERPVNNVRKAKSGSNKKLKINTQQCYVCFKLFDTRKKLTDHCKDHFDLCNYRTLKKCPICGHVTDSSVTKHIWEAHKVDLKVNYSNIKEKSNTGGSRYCYNVSNDEIKEIDIIPSVRNLNQRASLEIDRRNRELKDKLVAKAKLIKKGKEWVVDKEVVDVKSFLLPKFNKDDFRDINLGKDDYLAKMQELSRMAKRKGLKVLFPCDKCEKICLSLCGLKLHDRRHQIAPKPYKPKVWKHKLKGKPVVKRKPVKVNPANRLSDPKPILQKHRCDEKLKEFYKRNIKGGDIEFWQFLKIFNKMGRENVESFEDLGSNTDFGIHNECVIEDNSHSEQINDSKNVRNTSEVSKKYKAGKKRENRSFIRTVRMSKKDYMRREAVRAKLRDDIAKREASNHEHDK